MLRDKRNWTAEQKLQAILPVIRGEVGLAEQPRRLKVAESQLYRWQDQANAALLEAFSTNGPSSRERELEDKVSELERPNQAWQIDATKVYTDLDGWVWQTSVLDLYDQRIVRHVVRKTCRAEDAKDVLAIALDRAFGESRPEGLSLIHDRGSQFTAWSFKKMVE